MRGHRRTRRVTWEVGMVVDWHEKQHWLIIIWLWLDPLLWNPWEHFRFVNTTPVCEASSWQRVDRIFRTGRGDFKSKMMINAHILIPGWQLQEQLEKHVSFTVNSINNSYCVQIKASIFKLRITIYRCVPCAPATNPYVILHHNDIGG